MVVEESAPAPALARRVAQAKKNRNAVILAHNYQIAEVQDIADFVGDSLGLSQQAARVEADVIVFCGVLFMAETAKIVNPGRLVLMPDPNAGCPMANMITPRQLAEARRNHPDAAVVCYVNSSAAVKALSDICCTSANAVRIVESLPPEQPILFVPDMSLGDYVAKKTRRENIILWPGFCPTHHRILAEHVTARRAEHPDAEVCVHPECTADVLAMADFIGSTSQILQHVKESPRKSFVIGTEIGICHTLRRQNPGKEIIEISRLADCPNMKLTTVEKILWSLEDMQYEVTVPEDVAAGARSAIQKMLDLS